MQWASRHHRFSSYSNGNPWLSWFICATFPFYPPNKTRQSMISVGCLTSYNLLPPELHPLRAQHLPYIHIFCSQLSFREPSRATTCFTGTAFARFPPTSVHFTIPRNSPPICLNRSSHGVCSQNQHAQQRKNIFSFLFLFSSRLLP